MLIASGEKSRPVTFSAAPGKGQGVAAEMTLQVGEAFPTHVAELAIFNRVERIVAGPQLRHAVRRRSRPRYG